MTPRKFRPRFAVPGVAVLALAGAGAAGYLGGWWIPNQPDLHAFPVRGIDVSHHQGTIDWKAVPREKCQFVYIKATEGGDFRDRNFGENWRGSADAGLRRGAYHFFSLKTPGARQAANFIETVPLDAEALPPVIDLEYSGNPSRPTVKDFQAELAVFITALKARYEREPVIYTAKDFRDAYLADFPTGPLWMRAVVLKPQLPAGEKWTLWQYSEKGRMPGIAGFVDLNVFHGDAPAFEAFARRR